MSGEASPVCDSCFDIGFVYETVDDVERVAPCSCRTPAGDRRASPGRDLPPGYRRCTLGNFEPRTAALTAALRATFAYCNEFPHRGDDRGLGLLFWGAQNTGKTHLAAAAMQELVANRGITACFWDFGDLLKEISRSYDQSTFTTELSTLESAMRVDLLVLDDLASKRMHDWMRNTLFEIVDARYRRRLPTLVTTTFEENDPELSPHASYKRDEFLVERVGSRVRSRLLEMCTVIPTQDPHERAPRPARRPNDLRGLRKHLRKD